MYGIDILPSQFYKKRSPSIGRILFKPYTTYEKLLFKLFELLFVLDYKRVNLPSVSASKLHETNN